MRLFDAHFHIIDSAFPLVPNQGYLPAEFTVQHYRSRLDSIALAGGAVVSGSFQAFNQEYLIAALKGLGSNYYGVANIPADISESDLIELDVAGVRAVRFNLVRGGSAAVEHLEYLSQKLHEKFGWHTELYLNNDDIPALLPVLEQLPSFSIDHLGLSEPGLPYLFSLVESGAKVKASGFGRLSFDPVPVMQQIMRINPAALLFGTDLPSTRAKIPFSLDHIKLIKDNFSESECQMIFLQNAQSWYRN